MLIRSWWPYVFCHWLGILTGWKDSGEIHITGHGDRGTLGRHYYLKHLQCVSEKQLCSYRAGQSMVRKWHAVASYTQRYRGGFEFA
jgi:hypothetical protein